MQYILARRGYPPGAIDAVFGPMTDTALRNFQRALGLSPDGLAGPATIAGLRHGSASRGTTPVVNGPVRLLRPVPGRIGDGFGARRKGGRTHTGIDFPVQAGTRVGAAGVGVTEFAGWNTGGYGNLVVVRHRLGYTTWYAHLSSITTFVGEQVTGGTRLGFVGSTGNSTGPHLHFELRKNAVPIDPMPYLLQTVATRASSAGGGGGAGAGAGVGTTAAAWLPVRARSASRSSVTPRRAGRLPREEPDAGPLAARSLGALRRPRRARRLPREEPDPRPLASGATCSASTRVPSRAGRGPCRASPRPRPSRAPPRGSSVRRRPPRSRSPCRGRIR